MLEDNMNQCLKKFSEMSFSYNAYMDFMEQQEEVLRDDVMITAFRDAIRERHGQLFEGATVLVLGCGSVVLAMLVAKQGAARVFVLESANVAQVVRQLVRENGLDNVIEVIQGDISVVNLPPIDVIVSKWMGACLLHSSVLDRIIYARDRWLKPKGLIFPDTARLYLSVAEERHTEPPRDLWSRYAGFNMSRVAHVVEQLPKVGSVWARQMLAEPQEIWKMDLRTIKSDQLSFAAPFQLQVQRQDIIDLFVVHFDFSFPGDTVEETVSTSPWHPGTHWQQTLFHVDRNLPICLGETISGTFAVTRGANYLDIDIVWGFHRRLVKIKKHKQIFRMYGGCKDKP